MGNLRTGVIREFLMETIPWWPMNELWSRRELPGYLAVGLLIVATGVENGLCRPLLLMSLQGNRY